MFSVRFSLSAAVILWLSLGLARDDAAPVERPTGAVTTRAALPDEDPLAFFHPYIRVVPDERRAVDAGQVVVRVLPGRDRELAVFALGAVKAGPDTLVERVNDIAQFKKSPLVLAIERFSDPPRPEDVARLSLDDADLHAIQRCRPGACKIKLGTDEMTRLREAASRAGPRWKDAVQDAFRSVVLERVQTYRKSGHRSLPRYQDHPHHDDAAEAFATIMQRSPYLQWRMPDVAAYLDRYPAVESGAMQSFLYWSKESVGPKPLLSVTHVVIARGDSRAALPSVLIAAKQVFSTHYSDGSLSLTALFDQIGSAKGPYLVYVNRSIVDGLDGMLGGLRRSIVERRLREGTEKNFQMQRDRLAAR